MIVDLAKVWVDQKVFNIQVHDFVGQDKVWLIDRYKFLQEVTEDFFDFRFVSLNANPEKVHIQIGAGSRSASYVGEDCLYSHLRNGRYATQYKRAHIEDRRQNIPIHEGFHFIGMKHPHEAEALVKRDPARFLIYGNPKFEDDVLAYASIFGKRNLYPSINELKTVKSYPELIQYAIAYREKDRDMCYCEFD